MKYRAVPYKTWLGSHWWNIQKRPWWWPFWSHVAFETSDDSAKAALRHLKQPILK